MLDNQIAFSKKGNRCKSCTISSLYTGNAESCVYAQSLGNWEDDSGVLICKSGNLPAIGTGILNTGSRVIGCTIIQKLLARCRSFFV